MISSGQRAVRKETNVPLHNRSLELIVLTYIYCALCTVAENNLPHADANSLKSSEDKCIMQTVGNSKLRPIGANFSVWAHARHVISGTVRHFSFHFHLPYCIHYLICF